LASDEECMCYVREYVPLAGLTDDRNVRDQLVPLARGWMAAALRKRRSDAEARVLTLSITATTELSVARSAARVSFYERARHAVLTLNPGERRCWATYY
jgi:hypothetical protein